MKYSDFVLEARPRAAAIPTVKPDKEGERLVRESLAFLVAKHAFYAHPIYNEMHIVYTDHPMIPYAATDARSIFYNPWGMAKAGMGIQEVAFVGAHEVGHWLFGHLLLAQKYELQNNVFTGTRTLPYLPQLMNMAEDFVINAQLIEGKVGKMPSIGCFDEKISAKGMEASVEVYDKLYKMGQGKSGQHGMPGGGSMDVHLRVDKSQQKQEDSGAKIQAIAAAIESARAANQMGSLPGAIQRMVTNLLEPKVPWQDKLKNSMMRASGDPVYDWRHLDKRLVVRPDPMYFARQGHTGAGCIVLAADNSGSIYSQAMIDRFASEMAAICADLNPQQLIVIWCDAKIQRYDELDEPEDMLELFAEWQTTGISGGGGTNFCPVFEKVQEMGLEPDMLCYFTDLAGTFPTHEPNYPCIWATIVPGSKAPWGETIEIEIE